MADFGSGWTPVCLIMAPVACLVIRDVFSVRRHFCSVTCGISLVLQDICFVTPSRVPQTKVMPDFFPRKYVSIQYSKLGFAH